MAIQGGVISWAYPRLVSPRRWGTRAIQFTLAAGGLSWTFTTLAVAAKHVMTSVPTYMLLETGFTVAQFTVVAPLVAWAHAGTKGQAPGLA
jgi:hypothetical protein